MTSRIYLATKNPHKVREILEILKDTGVEVRLCPENIVLPDETGDTFEENAYQKAGYMQQFLPEEQVVAEDSGLMVASLDGQPGVHSARFSGEECNYRKNIEKLLQVMAPYKDAEARQAKFVTVVCLLNKKEKKFFRGEAAGVITFSPRGSHGFGYDPVFEVPGLGRTFAELSPVEKNAISHRSIAFRKLAAYLIREGSRSA